MCVKRWKPLSGATGPPGSRSTMTTSKSYLSAIFLEPGVRGPEAAWDFLVEAMDSFEAVPMDEAALVDAGTGKVLVHQSPDMRGKESGAEVTWEYWLVVTVRHGRIVRTQWFVNSAEALEAAGLQE